MSFVSLRFFAFLGIGLGLYYTILKRFQWIWLLFLSYVFYSFGGITAMGYLLLTTLTTYISGMYLQKANDKIQSQKKDVNKVKKWKQQKKQFVFLTLLCNFGILFFLKYWQTVVNVLHYRTGILLPSLELVLPLGLSFYMFQSIGYVIDVYRGKYPAEKNILKYALFVSFFPQMVQGPISRFGDLKKELYQKHAFDFTSIEAGLRLMLWGYFKKLLIADRASVVVNTIFDGYTGYAGSVILFGVILYYIQLYCDFSGGIDITRGVARLFGVHLIENFKRPIFSTSLQDYWRRWHMSLGAWMKDYVFYPLSLSKPFLKLGSFVRKHIKGKAGQVLPVSMATFVVYFLIGIWHGANFKYIVFGLWNGILITLSILLTPFFIKIKKKLNIEDKNPIYHGFMVLRTFLIVLIGRYMTRAKNVTAMWQMLKLTVTSFSLKALTSKTLMTLGIEKKDYLVILCGTLLLLLVEFLEEKEIDVSAKSKKLPVIVQVVGMFLFIGAIVVLGVYKDDYIASEFIYKQF